MKKRVIKWIKVGALPVLVLIVIGIHIVHFYKESTLPKYEKGLEEISDSWDIDSKDNRDEYVLLKKTDNMVCVVNAVSEENSIGKCKMVGQKYVYCEKVKGKGYHIRNSINALLGVRMSYKYSEDTIDLYDIATGDFIKNIDLLKIAEEYPEYYMYGSIETVYIEGKEYFLLGMIPVDPEVYLIEGYDTCDYLLLDVVTEKSTLINEDQAFTYKNNNITDTTFFDELACWASEKGIESNSKDDYLYAYPNTNKQDDVLVSIVTSRLPKTNLELYKVFPELAQYKGKEGFRMTLTASTADMRKLLFEEVQ